MSTPLPDLERFVRRAQEGDKNAFAEIYDAYFSLIYRYVYFRASAEHVDDLVETIFVKAWMNLKKYQRRQAGFNAWIFRIAHNTVVDHHRTHRAILPIEPGLEDERPESAPKQQAGRQLLSEQLRQALTHLKEGHREVITLKFLMGFENAEIAEMMKTSESNVRVVQFRALKSLKKILEKEGIAADFL